MTTLKGVVKSWSSLEGLDMIIVSVWNDGIQFHSIFPGRYSSCCTSKVTEVKKRELGRDI